MRDTGRELPAPPEPPEASSPPAKAGGRLARAVAVAFLAVLLAAGAGAGALAWAWRDRASPAALGWAAASPAAEQTTGITVTWLGITTLLFDDGETQILTDGAFSRLSLFEILTLRPVYSDINVINHALSRYRIDRLAALVPVHSHFDHAMDAGHVANRTGAIVLGSESTANIVRGERVPVRQYQILASGESRQFGDFGITLVESAHAPLAGSNRPPISGTIDEPLTQPARVLDWREGGSWSVLLRHPAGTALVQASGGFVPGSLPEGEVDVVLLGIAGLSRLGREHTAAYWRETVERTGARRVHPIHFEDFTRPFGNVLLFPRVVDDVTVTAGWLDELAAESGVEISRLPFGQPVELFPPQ